MGKKKASGFDDLTVEILCKSWSKIKEKVVKIMNTALKETKSFKNWKIGVVKMLYKGLGKDPQLPKSYRPLTPVMGNLYEKVINKS